MEPKPCAHCGAAAIKMRVHEEQPEWTWCAKCDYGFSTVEEWNRRAGEDALDLAIERQRRELVDLKARLEAALRAGKEAELRLAAEPEKRRKLEERDKQLLEVIRIAHKTLVILHPKALHPVPPNKICPLCFNIEEMMDLLEGRPVKPTPPQDECQTLLELAAEFRIAMDDDDKRRATSLAALTGGAGLSMTASKRFNIFKRRR